LRNLAQARIPPLAQDKAIALGHPSYVWGFGQERRLEIIRSHVPLEAQAILDVGCGLGMYVRAFRRFSQDVHGVDLDPEKVTEASRHLPNIYLAPAEALPFPDGRFDVVLSHEVIEHVTNDQKAIDEAIRVLRSPRAADPKYKQGAKLAEDNGPKADPSQGVKGGRLVVFAPNRLYPFETHGAYWRGRYHFGNIPLVNYLPSRWRTRFCPHVRAYTRREMRRLVAGHPVRVMVHTQIFPGYDKIVSRRPALGRVLRWFTYLLERTPARALGLSHLLIVEKTA
jgi:SAM-dependent methyltransferase